MNKKQGTIRVCIELCDLNPACPKDNSLTPFIEKIIDECASNEVLFFSWMVFQGIIKLKSGNKISIRPPSPLLGGLLLITLCHLG
jgi:hypothetical protein